MAKTSDPKRQNVRKAQPAPAPSRYKKPDLRKGPRLSDVTAISGGSNPPP